MADEIPTIKIDVSSEEETPRGSHKKKRDDPNHLGANSAWDSDSKRVPRIDLSAFGLRLLFSSIGVVAYLLKFGQDLSREETF